MFQDSRERLFGSLEEEKELCWFAINECTKKKGILTIYSLLI